MCKRLQVKNEMTRTPTSTVIYLLSAGVQHANPNHIHLQCSREEIEAETHTQELRTMQTTHVLHTTTLHRRRLCHHTCVSPLAYMRLHCQLLLTHAPLLLLLPQQQAPHGFSEPVLAYSGLYDSGSGAGAAMM
jgi:hypothetical protein